MIYSFVITALWNIYSSMYPKIRGWLMSEEKPSGNMKNDKFSNDKLSGV